MERYANSAGSSLSKSCVTNEAKSSTFPFLVSRSRQGRFGGGHCGRETIRLRPQHPAGMGANGFMCCRYGHCRTGPYGRGEA